METRGCVLFDDAAVAASGPPSRSIPHFQGKEGLAKVRAGHEAGRPYAMAFVDVRMPPGWDGVETALRLWEVCPDLQIVICTAYSDYSWDEMAAKLGNSDSVGRFEETL